MLSSLGPMSQHEISDGVDAMGELKDWKTQLVIIRNKAQWLIEELNKAIDD